MPAIRRHLHRGFDAGSDLNGTAAPHVGVLRDVVIVGANGGSRAGL